MDSNPLFSIIVPTRNRGHLLTKGINSVINQVFTDWELVIVDDESTDNTKAIVEGFSDSRIKYCYQKHKERSTARNKGITLATGRYLCFLDDDDYLLPGFLKDFSSYLIEHNYPSVILRTGFYRSANKVLSPAINYKENIHANPVQFALFNMCGIWSLCIPKESLKEKKFPDNIYYWEDTYLILQLLMEYPFVQLDNFQYVYELHEEMGSVKFYKSPDLKNLVDHNISAMQDFFKKFGQPIKKFVPPWSENYIISEKYLSHAIGSINYGFKRKSLFFLKKSFSYPCFRKKIWKRYLIWLIKFITPTF